MHTVIIIDNKSKCKIMYLNVWFLSVSVSGVSGAVAPDKFTLSFNYL